MKKKYIEEITPILQNIKTNSKLIGGGSGEKERWEYRDVNVIWELGTSIKKILDYEKIPPELHIEYVSDIVKKVDKKIFEKSDGWSDFAYKMILDFPEKDYFFKICKFAGYRESPKQNRFRKGDIRYLTPYFSKKYEPQISAEKMKKLESALSDDSILEKSSEEVRLLIKKFGDAKKIKWSLLKEMLNDLLCRVYNITGNMDESLEDRNQFREEVGDVLLSQISAALQLCIIDNESDFKWGYEKAKKSVFSEKPKSKNQDYLDLFSSLKDLLKDFKMKSKLISKNDYHGYHKLSSILHVIKDENDLKNFLNRGKSMSDIFG